MFSITWSNKRRSLFLRRYVNVLRISAILRIPKDVNVLRSSFVHIKDQKYVSLSVPDELLEAARIDGSGEVRTFESLAQA